VLTDTSSLVNQTIQAILTPACESVHPAWVNEMTTPIATSMAVVHLANGTLLLVKPCELRLDPNKYSSLGLELTACSPKMLHWNAPDGAPVTMQPIDAVMALLPFHVTAVEQTDLLQEGAVSELALLNQAGARIVLRHIMPPMTLGIDTKRLSQTPNHLFTADGSAAA
jgi:hypothetical protein